MMRCSVSHQAEENGSHQTDRFKLSACAGSEATQQMCQYTGSSCPMQGRTDLCGKLGSYRVIRVRPVEFRRSKPTKIWLHEGGLCIGGVHDPQN